MEKFTFPRKTKLTKDQDKKLRKEENLNLIRKLASAKVDTSLLRSSRSLGATKPSKRPDSENIKRELHYGVREEKVEGDDSDFSDESAISNFSHLKLQNPNKPALGSGLKRPIDSSIHGNHITKKRRRTKKTKPIFKVDTEEPPWEGFSSDEPLHLSGRHSESPPPSTGTQTASEEDAYDNTKGDRSEESSIEDAPDDEDHEVRKERSSAFKTWALQQVNEALGLTPTATSTSLQGGVPLSTGTAKPELRNPRSQEQNPLPPELETTNSTFERKAFSVDVVRSPEIQEARLGLSVVAEEQKIMEAIYNNPVTVICGATGSGKTTQVPQFLIEAGYGKSNSPNPGMIGITQPRRVAAVSMAKRVDHELGAMGGTVAYQIRFDSSVSDKTAVKFMTDGILIREITNDFALLKYSVIIIDEAHERSANTDILIGMVSRIVELRAVMSKEDTNVRPLKLVIMSATLRITDFMENPNLFGSSRPPLIQAEGRKFPVTVHFARKTQRDYVNEAFHKVCRGHKKLPPGGMLVFLTGQNEITALAKRLKDALSDTQNVYITRHKVRIAASEAPLETEDLELGTGASQYDEVGEIGEEDDDDQDDVFDNPDGKEFEIDDPTPALSQVRILPLYSQLQTKDQLRVFEKPPENTRLIILATNVAETSLTIPGIRYVFDTGRAKERKYDKMTGVQSFEVGWISKASASQRAGRAGRTGPGHCYRLYSSAVYERDFEEHAEPEILRMPVEGVVLQLKSMDLQHVVNFPFPTPPDRQSLARAEKLLSYLGAVSPEGKITNVGRELSNYPLSPRYSKMLTIGHQHGCMPYTIALVAALATPNLFIAENQLGLYTSTQSGIYTNEDRQANEASAKLRNAYNHAHRLFSRYSSTSDALKALTALCAYAYAPAKDTFCNDMFLSPKALNEASNLRSQLIAIASNNDVTAMPSQNPLQLPSPSKTQISALQQFTAAAFIDQIVILASASPSPPDLPRKPTRAIDMPYLPLFPINIRRKTDIDIVDVAVFIHPSSILAHTPVEDLPTYIIYSHLQRGTPATVEGAKKPRTRLHALTAVTGKQIAGLAKGTPLLVYGKPIGKIEEHDSKTRTCWVVPSLMGEKGSMGWPLPAQKVVQKKNARGEWVIEEVVG